MEKDKNASFGKGKIRKKNPQILIVGGFPPPIGGETEKNKTLRIVLQKFGYEVHSLNTSYWKSKKNIVFLRLLQIIKYNFIFVSVADTGLFNLLPFLYILSKFFGKNICILVIGGKLSDHISNKNIILRKLYIYFLKNVNLIVSETRSLLTQIKKLGVLNAIQEPNFKIKPFIPYLRNRQAKKLRLVFLSRVTESKGVFDAIEACKIANEHITDEITLDIYGPGDKNIIRKVKSLETKLSYIRYKGIASPENVVSILAEYDLMLFPTYHFGEGFPGVFIDAMFANIPVITTDWRFNKEVIKDGCNGYIVPIKDPKAIAEKILFLYKNKDILLDMKNNCLKESSKYYAENVVKDLIKILRKKGWEI